MSLDGRVALITGAGRGIGRATAVRLAREGAKVAINFKGNAAAAEEAKRLVESAGGSATLVQGDVSADGQADDVVKKAVAFGGGKLDILVNNAGITRDNLLLRMSAEDIANAIAFLVSDDASYITGQVLIVDGGMVTA